MKGLFILFLCLGIGQLEAQSNKDSLQKHVFILSNIKPFRSAENIESLNKAAQYVYDKFKAQTQNVFKQPYVVEGKKFQNVICSFGPEDGQRLILGAHYDSHSNTPGADDNASGVAGLLELARLLSINKTNLEYRVDLVAYSTEEPPYFGTEHMGSYKHAISLRENDIPIMGMISLECIGYFSDKKRSQRFPFFGYRLAHGSQGDFIAIVQKLRSGRWVKDFRYELPRFAKGRVKVIKVRPLLKLRGISYSDHMNYWNAGYPAMMITNTAFLRNKNYHKATDIAQSLDYNKMSAVVDMVYQGVVRFNGYKKVYY